MKKMHKWKQKVYQWLMPDDDMRLMFRLQKIGYVYNEPKVVTTQMVLDSKSHAFLATAEGKDTCYDAAYGLTRQLADQLRPYVKYTESYDEELDEWTCRVSLKVVAD